MKNEINRNMWLCLLLDVFRGSRKLDVFLFAGCVSGIQKLWGLASSCWKVFFRSLIQFPESCSRARHPVAGESVLESVGNFICR